MTNEKRKPRKALSGADKAPIGNGASLPQLKWVNVYFNDDDLEELHDLLDTINVFVCSFVLDLPPSYDLSAKYDARSNRWAARLICSDPEHVNANCALTVRAATRLDAVYALAYAYKHKMPEVWAEGDDTPQARFG